jgi:predicted NAD/FAD-binding protein
MRIAVVGTGIAGMGAAWALNRRHDITVYEAASRIGGHSNTVDAPGLHPGETIPVDTGFIVFNEATYPNLIRLFETLGVPTEPSNMSFAVSAGSGRLEYSGNNLLTLFSSARCFVRPSHYRMIRDILRFYREAPALLEDGAEEGLTLGDYLARGGYGHGFLYHHLLPMGAAIWSATVAEMMRFPASSFVRFFHNHGLLKTKGRPQWWTVSGGSREYVRRITAGYADRVRTGCPVVDVRRAPAGAIVRDATGGEERYEAVVLAGHADQSLAMLADADAEERSVLGAFRYEGNRAVLHTDAGLMPKRRRAWASWNYMTNGKFDAEAKVSVTYWMNLLQTIDRRAPLFVSLNPLHEPAAGSVIAEFAYDHPQFDQAAVDAQARLRLIQGRGGVWYCGSYCGYGFHEDGLASGLAVGEALGVPRPWDVADISPAFANATPVDPAYLMAAE